MKKMTPDKNEASKMSQTEMPDFEAIPENARDNRKITVSLIDVGVLWRRFSVFMREPLTSKKYDTTIGPALFLLLWFTLCLLSYYFGRPWNWR